MIMLSHLPSVTLFFFQLLKPSLECADFMKEQDQKMRLRGLDAQKSNIAAGVAESRILRTPLGPKDMDKMKQSPAGDLVITNDGATFLEHMHVDNQIAKVMVANHPDAGGSDYLASKINEDKDIMLGKTKGGGSAF
ncbi:uncharacterized protein A4U43_C04F29390 [Asparagus officinalis]|uniref:Uncharacterized protein n=2 Tax=Asparagus officinalis TaxID=4686 RepID=A0A5P1F9T7_ASPOF|nr:uncharacterized protein A4U43_C04F29390 [Asparagus officinalis]